MEKQELEALLSEVSKQVKSVVDGEMKATYDTVNVLANKMADLTNNANATKEIKDEVVRLANEINSFKETAREVVSYGDLRTQLKSWQNFNKESIAKLKNGQKADLTPFVLKENKPMTPANTYNGSAYLPKPEFASGVVDIVRVQPTFWDYIVKGRTGSAAYVWVNKTTPLGAAGFIAPGVAKPGISVEFETQISNAKKVAVSSKAATELFEDMEGFASFLELEIAYQLKYEINNKLMTGVASSTVPAGIQTLSVPYTLTTVSTTDPNIYDCIRACVAQIRSGNLGGRVTAFLNPIDYANLQMSKAISQGQQFLGYDTGADIVEDNNIPVGFLQVAILDYYKVLIYKDFTVTYGMENDDLTKNLVTVIGEMRLHQFFSTNHTGAFVYDSIADIKTAITA